ncbi:carboxymuconolactone decarboxylase family protein [Streptosporangium sp. NPDC005286]|uniref:carboxymuconolactone decarboxylase family protein n=1 Tax=Streptosporangium sp. NPDC005286 TaxID=3154463 RepID=UPI0033A61F1D
MYYEHLSESVWIAYDGTTRNATYVRGDMSGGMLVGTLDSADATRQLLSYGDGAAKVVVLTDTDSGQHIPDYATTLTSVETATALARCPLLDAAEVERGSPLDAYLGRSQRTHGIAARRLTPDQTFSGAADLKLGHTLVEVQDIGRAYSTADTIVWLPDEAVLITGAAVVNGVHPASWSGSIELWRAACVQLAALRPTVVVPGYGPVTDITGIIDLRDYLEHLHSEAEVRYRKGMPVEEAVAELPLGRWDQWDCRENLAITLATVYKSLGDSTDRTVTGVLTTAAEIAEGIRRRPRIAPVAPGERDQETLDALGLIEGENSIFELHRVNIPNILTTFVRHTKLYKESVPLARGVIDGVLPPRHRELAILRGAWACSAIYQWNHHYLVALSVGLTREEIDLISQDISLGPWTRHERAVLTAVDELHTESVVSDHTWETLSETYGERELIELVTLIGEYHKVSFALNSWGVPLEPWMGPYRIPSGWRTAQHGRATPLDDVSRGELGEFPVAGQRGGEAEEGEEAAALASGPDGETAVAEQPAPRPHAVWSLDRPAAAHDAGR